MPDLKHALDEAFNQTIENQFNNLVAQLVAPTYNAYDKSTPIERFEHIVKIVLDAYDQASKVIEKLQP